VIEPSWISAEEALAIQERLIVRFGGVGAGVRDENLFQAALARPLNKWHYDDPKPDLFALAATYAFALAKRHVFHDGNKRTAYVVAVTFLDMNGVACAPEQSDIIDTMVALADGSVSEKDLADWLRKNARRRIGLGESPSKPLSSAPRKRPGRQAKRTATKRIVVSSKERP
jgi:death on curing protein